MNVFLDANVLISVLNKEYPVFSYSARVLSSMEQINNLQLFTSPLCLAISFYFAEKKSGSKLAGEKIRLLSEKISITTVNEMTVEQSLKNKRIKDFEDGLQYYSALNSKCDIIVTEDLNGFYFSELEVLNSKSFVEKYLRAK